MPKSAWLGHKVRRLRRERGMTQTELARRVGISPSYLNMIEHNQRPITFALMQRIAAVFDIDPHTLSQDEDARLLTELGELLSDPVFADHEIRREDMYQAVTVAPSLCRALATLFDAYRNARNAVDDLSERLSDESFLTTSAYELRSLLTPIRSFSEILHDNADLSAEQRKTFTAILARESARLSDIIARMLEFTSGERFATLERVTSPNEQVGSFIQDRGNHFPELEEVAERLRRTLGVEGGRDTYEALGAHLAAAHGIAVVQEPIGGDPHPPVRFDRRRRRLFLSEALPRSSQIFRMAQRVALEEFAAEIEAQLDSGQLRTEEARTLAREALAGYVAGAFLMPYDLILEAAQATRYDIELLESRFAASFEQICHRLTTLQRSDAAGIPFHFLRIDIAGNVSKRFSASGFRLPRHGSVCPRLNVHSAFMTPGTIQVQTARMPDGTSYFNLARTVTKPSWGGRGPRLHFAICLGCEVAYARELVYSDGVDLENEEAMIPVGTTCRLCERYECEHRAFAPVLETLGAMARPVAASRPAARG